jgi:hypothetical protein
VLGFSVRQLRACLLAWRQQARVLSGATHMLRRLLVSTLKGAFHEWRIVARERAHWHRVRSAAVQTHGLLGACLSAFGQSSRRCCAHSLPVLQNRWKSSF